MLMTDLIVKKRDGHKLTSEEIDFFIQGYTRGDIPDYQMAAMCMAIYFSGMDDEEILALTMSMMNSGDVLDLSNIDGVKADKHSTGGVGDKTSLVLCPMVSACGLKIAKMSGRGLGHTGGTIDKLESFPGFTTGISDDEFIKNVNDIGISIIGQTLNLDPADKKIYALRDVTGTVPSIPLIVSSIMSKKLASGADVIVLDVKVGSGSFMKTQAQAEELALKLTQVGKLAGRKCSAVITDMDQPLGCMVGNALEVKEAIATLKGESEGELLELCLTIGSLMLVNAGFCTDEAEAREKLRGTIRDGSALKKLAQMVEAQHGDPSGVYDTSLLPSTLATVNVFALEGGYVGHINAEEIGLVSMLLGGGRATKQSVIDLSVGVVLNKKVGDSVKEGELLATLHISSLDHIKEAADRIRSAYIISKEPVEKPAFIKAVIN